MYCIRPEMILRYLYYCLISVVKCQSLPSRTNLPGIHTVILIHTTQKTNKIWRYEHRIGRLDTVMFFSFPNQKIKIYNLKLKTTPKTSMDFDSALAVFWLSCHLSVFPASLAQ